MFILISKETERARRLVARLAQKGIFSFICTPEEGLACCEEKDTGGVLLDCTLDKRAVERLGRALRRAYPELPIAALAHPKELLDLPADRILRYVDEETLFEALLDFCHQGCGWPEEAMQTYYLTVGETHKEIYYMGYPLPLSPRGHLILRCIFYRAPQPISSEDLCALCYPEGGSRQNLAVQIHHINRAAKKIYPKPLIVNEYGRGYQLRDGIL